MKDRTQPLPAPAGYKWHIYQTGMKYEGHDGPIFELQLWPVDGTVPEFFDGDDKRHWIDDLRQPAGEASFEREGQINRASRLAIRDMGRKKAAEAREASIMALNGRLK